MDIIAAAVEDRVRDRECVYTTLHILNAMAYGSHVYIPCQILNIFRLWDKIGQPAAYPAESQNIEAVSFVEK